MNLLADIKDAGILAGFELWGWPYHGLCTDGVIDLGGGLSHTIATPSHGSAWLYDMGLPAIDRTPDQLIADAALGHIWRNYSMISGGVLYGTRLGANQFIHVDAASVPWLVSLAYSYPEASLQRVRITVSIVRFGLFGEGVLTPIEVVRDVQCSYYTYMMYGYTYDGPTTGTLEDVWTNGSKFLVSIAQTRVTGPTLKDIFSLIEIEISGSGGSDGSGLAIAASEIMKDTDLSKSGSLVAAFDPSTIPEGGYSLVETYTNTGGFCGNSTWDWPADYIHWERSQMFDTDGFEYRYARYAYYTPAGAPKAAILNIKYESKYWYVSHDQGSGGVQTCTGPDCSVGCTWDVSDCGVWTRTFCDGHAKYGIFLMENTTVMDWLEWYRPENVVYEKVHSGSYPNEYRNVDGFGYTSPFGYTTGGAGSAPSTNTRHTRTEGTPVWQGSLAGSLALPPAPGTIDPYGTPPLDSEDLVLAWRSNDSDHESFGASVVAGTAELGIQRIDAKAAAFYIPGSTRTYGPVLTPLGIKTAGITPAANLYLAWQRKTSDFSFAASPICYV